MVKHLVLRTPSGISGDMLLAGFALMAGMTQAKIDELCEGFGLPELKNSVRIRSVEVHGIAGWRAEIRLGCGHHGGHSKRTYRDIQEIIGQSALSVSAKEIALKTFSLLARVEGEIHGLPADEVGFHEIGSLDSILDVCLSASFFDELGADAFFCSPLPVCDGVIPCAHGLLASPAPATLKLLEGVPVYGIDSEGETVTPTAIALLKALGACFGRWPSLRIEKTARVYGTRTLPRVPNGAIFSCGEPAPDPSWISEPT